MSFAPRLSRAAGLALAGTLIWSAAALAETPLEMCNKTELPVDCMVGVTVDGTVTVSGAHRIEAGQCKAFQNVSDNFYYHCVEMQYNEEASRWLEVGRWEGGTTFCVPQYQKTFSLAQAERLTKDCEAHGYTSLGFEREAIEGDDIIEIDLED